MSGLAMEFGGPDGMPVLAALLSVLFLALLIHETRKAARAAGQPASKAAD
tara:strand:+ start:103 stop:252 length:150 start_codon:yes stop_codon:yes gene_type:complete